MSSALTLTFHGAAGTVTGSCMELRLGDKAILIDCGLFQGSRTLETLNHGAFSFDPGKIDAVVLTHAHIDHCGLLPKLSAQGFDKPIWCTPATSDLLEYMLADAGRIQEAEADRRNRRRDRAGESRFEPLYTEQDALTAWRLTRPTPLCDWFDPAPGFRARFWNAGHILGAASVEIEAAGSRLLLSGDLGPINKAFHPDPQAPTGLDHVVCEATYGDRARDKLTIEQRRTQLEGEIKDALSRGGNLIIPSFALERTQELLLDLAKLADANRIPNVPIFVDSPSPAARPRCSPLTRRNWRIPAAKTYSPTRRSIMSRTSQNRSASTACPARSSWQRPACAKQAASAITSRIISSAGIPPSCSLAFRPRDRSAA